MQQPCPRTGGTTIFSTSRNCGRAAFLLHNRHLKNLYDLHNKDIDHLVNGLQQRNPYGLWKQTEPWGSASAPRPCRHTSADRTECPALRRRAESEAPPTSRTTWTAGTKHDHRDVHDTAFLSTPQTLPTRTIRETTLGLPGAALD